MGSRRRGRELALQVLYGLEFGQYSVDEALEQMHRRGDEPPSDDPELGTLVRGDAESRAFGEELVRGVHDHLDVVDEMLGRCSINWRVPRMARVDRNILRLAAYELLHRTDIPPRATLNEAVEIAKRYGDEDSASFVNGILDRVAKLART